MPYRFCKKSSPASSRFMAKLVAFIILLIAATSAFADDNVVVSKPVETAPQATLADNSVLVDSMAATVEPTDSIKKKPGFIARLLKSIAEANQKPITEKLSWSFIAGPHYGTDTKFGIGLSAGAQYRSDSVAIPSFMSIYGDICTSGSVMVGIEGSHIFPSNRSRIDYDAYVGYFPRYFWGIGYDKGIDHDNKTQFKEFRVMVKGGYSFQFAKNFYVGPLAEVQSSWATKRSSLDPWAGLKEHILAVGVGAKIYYDSRDNLTATKKGSYVLLEQYFYPKFLGNTNGFNSTELKYLQFVPAWKGATLAFALQGIYCYGDVPWAKMPTFGGSHFMRGYYEGRFMDKCMINAVVEVRQHIWRWISVAAWGGAATVAPSLKDLTFKHVLPCGGAGVRWEVRKNSSIRLDVGFGKQDMGIVFRINEAF